jgi:hypothetical protein
MRTDRRISGSLLLRAAALLSMTQPVAAQKSVQASSHLLGEAVAISILRDQRSTCNEPLSGFAFTKFDGTTITV